MATQVVAVQLLASVTVTQYVPATRLFRSCVVAPPVHKYVYGVAPPVTVRLIDPFAPPKQDTLTAVFVRFGPFAVPTVAQTVLVQPCESVTVTQYVTEATFARSCVVALLLQW